MKLSDLRAYASIDMTLPDLNLSQGRVKLLVESIDAEAERLAALPQPGPKFNHATRKNEGDDVTDDHLRGRTRIVVNGVPFVGEPCIEKREQAAYIRGACANPGERKIAEARAQHGMRPSGDPIAAAFEALSEPQPSLAFDDPASHPAALRMMAKRLDEQVIVTRGLQVQINDHDGLLRTHATRLRAHIDATKRATDSLDNAMTDAENRLGKRLDVQASTINAQAASLEAMQALINTAAAAEPTMAKLQELAALMLAEMQKGARASDQLTDNRLEDLNQRLGAQQQAALTRVIGAKS